MCRLVAGAYYCGSLSSTAPWKGLSNTMDTPHVGTDVTNVRNAPNTGSMHYGPDVGSYSKVATPANPEYYAKADSVGRTGRDFVHAAENNGMFVNNPSRQMPGSSTTAIYNQATVGHKDPRPRYPVHSARSNYAMAPGDAKAYNSGINVVGGSGAAGSQYAVEPDGEY